jgi:hypothetical protein
MKRKKKLQVQKFGVSVNIDAERLLHEQAAGKKKMLGIRFRKYIPGSVNGKARCNSDERDYS